MNSLNKIVGLLLLGLVVLSGCNKPKYTASFAPSKSVKYVKATPAQKEVLSPSEAVVSTSKIIAPISESLEKKEIKLAPEKGLPTSSFTKTEVKEMKRELRKQVFKSAKKTLLKKGTGSGNHLLNIVLCFFIPPLAVFLHQEQRISNDFWLDLILLLTVVGSVIYALLVVLDVVSIA